MKKTLTVFLLIISCWLIAFKSNAQNCPPKDVHCPLQNNSEILLDSILQVLKHSGGGGGGCCPETNTLLAAIQNDVDTLVLLTVQGNDTARARLDSIAAAIKAATLAIDSLNFTADSLAKEVTLLQCKVLLQNIFNIEYEIDQAVTTVEQGYVATDSNYTSILWQPHSKKYFSVVVNPLFGTAPTNWSFTLEGNLGNNVPNGWTPIIQIGSAIPGSYLYKTYGTTVPFGFTQIRVRLTWSTPGTTPMQIQTASSF